MDSTIVRESRLIVDDGARHADTVARKERMPNFDTNGLRTCGEVAFTPEHKRRALDLVRPL